MLYNYSEIYAIKYTQNTANNDFIWPEITCNRLYLPDKGIKGNIAGWLY